MLDPHARRGAVEDAAGPKIEAKVHAYAAPAGRAAAVGNRDVHDRRARDGEAGHLQRGLVAGHRGSADREQPGPHAGVQVDGARSGEVDPAVHRHPEPAAQAAVRDLIGDAVGLALRARDDAVLPVEQVDPVVVGHPATVGRRRLAWGRGDASGDNARRRPRRCGRRRPAPTP